MLRPPEPDPTAARQRRIVQTLVVLVASIVAGYLVGLIWWPELMSWSPR